MLSRARYDVPPSTETAWAAQGRQSEKHADLDILARGGILNFGGAVAYAAFGFLLAVVVTRALGASDAGVFFEAVALFAIVTTVAQLGADVGLLRMLPRYRALGRTADVRRVLGPVFVPVFVASMILAGAIFALAPEISTLLLSGVHHEEAVPYIRVFAVALPLLTGSRVVISATRALGTVVPFVIVEYIGKSGLRLLFAIVVILLGWGNLALAASWALPALVAFVAAVWWLHALLGQADIKEPADDRIPTRSLGREFWAFTGPRGLAALFATTVLWLDVVLVGVLSSTEDAAIYFAATRYAIVGTIAVQTIVMVLGPQVSALIAEGRRDRVADLFRASSTWLAALSWPAYVSLAVLAPVFLGVFGEQFGRGETALLVIAGATLFNMATGPVTVVLLMAGKSSWNLANTIASFVVNIALNVVLIPPLGITGAAIALAASILVNKLAPLVQLWWVLRIHPFSVGLLVVTLGSAACYGVVGIGARLALGASPAVLALVATVGTVLYVGLLWRFRDAIEFSAIQRAARWRTTSGIPRTKPA